MKNGSENQNLRQEQIGSPYCFVPMYSDLITYKTTNPQDLKGNVNCSCKPSGCTARRTRQVPFSFLHWFHGCFGAKVGSTVKVCLNFFFF